MSILDWDDDEDCDIEIGQGSGATTEEELTLNANLSDDPLNIIPAGVLVPIQLEALERLKGLKLESGAVNMSESRISRDDKYMLGGGDVNQLIPFKYDWAWDKFINGVTNNWVPTEIQMQNDIAQWRDPNALTQTERRIIYNALGFFSTADTIVNNNLYDIARHVKNPEARMFINRQIYEESMHCYIDGTEILTEKGWVDFRELQKGTRVAQWYDNGNIDYVLPQQILHDHYKGPMYEFYNDEGSYQSIVSPNHRCVAIDPRDEYKVKIIKAEDFNPANYNIPAAGRLHIANAKQWTYMDSLAVAFQADGFLSNPQTENVGEVTGMRMLQFGFKKDRKIDRLLNIVNGANLKHTISKRENGQTIIYVWVPLDLPLDKSFDWIDISTIDKLWIDQFFTELTHWDGCLRTPDYSMCYTNTNKDAVDKVMTLANLSARRTSLFAIAAKGNRKEAYQVHVFAKSHYSGKSIKRRELQHDGHIHCVAVPTGMIITRYNGCVTVSGNTYSYQFIIQSLGLAESEVFNQYRENLSMAIKDNWCFRFTKPLEEREIDVKDLIRNLIAFYVVMEGIFFYCGFSSVLSLGRRGRMVGTAEQFQYILRDESQHLSFGIDLINTLIIENPEVWTADFQLEILELIEEGSVLETVYGYDINPEGCATITPRQNAQYMQHIASRRCEQLGLKSRLPPVANPFGWMAEAIDINKEKNFFETRVTDYQQGVDLKI